jgi:hypothetical protein
LNVHVIAYGRQLVLLGRNNLPILALDLPRGHPFLREPTGDDDTFSVFTWLERFVALILQTDRDF